MATTIALIFLAAVFFIILGRGADLLVGNLRAIADHTKIHPVLLGTLLGFLTTIPEFMVGLNAVSRGLPGLSLGNIWGGIMVILALILGSSIYLQREIKTDGRLVVILPSFILIILSLFLGLRGTLHYYDGALLMIAYFVLIYLDLKTGGQYHKDESTEKIVLEQEKVGGRWQRAMQWRKNLQREFIWALAGLALVSISSYVIMEIADIALTRLSVPPFLIGLLVFAIGTNLPEITVMLRSVKNKSGDLSFGHLVGSAVSNILVLSILTFIAPLTVNVNWRYYVLMLFIGLTLACISWFYVTKRRFERWEGAVLIALYLLFIAYELY
ncbi:MAG: hypothetical protein Q8Q67_00355 [bacterium]|nr:hypothetical protein [bacterium]